MLSVQEVSKNRQAFNETDQNIAGVFKVLSDVNRYRIFRLLIEQPKLSVGDISQILNISLPLASQHIKKLTDSDLLQKERDGKKIFTTLKHKNPFVPGIIHTIQEALK